MPAQSINSTTQQFLDIYDITDDYTIMKSGHVSVILSVAAMNFGLLAEEEQDAIMYAYAGLLNSLNYPIQVVVHSQTKDVTNYLQLLKQQEDTINNETMRRRISSYREFVANLIHERNVLDKKFYVVVSATAMELGFIGTSTFVPGKSGSFNIESIEKHILLDKAKSILEPRRDHLVGQFARIGLYSQQLHTQEIIQLFYLSYNPEAAEGQQITDSRSYTSPMVRARMEESVLDQPQPIADTSAAQPVVAVPATGAAVEPTSAPTAVPTPATTPSVAPVGAPSPVVPPAATPTPVPFAQPTTPAPTSTTKPLENDGAAAPAPIPSVFGGASPVSPSIKIEAASKPPLGLGAMPNLGTPVMPAAPTQPSATTQPTTAAPAEDPQAAINSLIGEADVAAPIAPTNALSGSEPGATAPINTTKPLENDDAAASTT